jgi:phosphopantetheinyl transferase (holo-ACP synthase)
MIGNDLVDLQEAQLQSNWRRKGYLDKIFSAAEQEQILKAEQPNQMVWLFWSMKEAVYKIDSKVTGIRSFAPASLVCSDLSINGSHSTGKVIVNQRTYVTETELNEAYIHSIAAQATATLQRIQKEIYVHPFNRFDYRLRNPACVSHHGQYLALIF